MLNGKKIKVLECIRQGKIGGGESHLLSLVENLDRNRFEPIVLSFTSGPMIEQLQQMGVETHVIYTEKPFDIRKWNAVKKLLLSKQIDLVHAHGTRANSNILWASKKLKIPVIYTIHGWSFHPDQKPLVKTLRLMGEKYLTSRSTLNISVSQSNKESGKELIPSFESVVVNNGINLQKFNPADQFKDIRAELKLPKDKILILFIARFTLHKQPLTLIKAFAEALKQNANMHLLMVGDGDQKEEAEKLIEQLHIGKQVTLEKFRQDVPDVLAAADIFVLPSLWEGLPIGLLEAMAMGKAIIASNADGTREIIEHNKNGVLVSINSLQKETTEALVQLSQQPQLRKELEAYARATITERFNAVSMTKTIESIYTKLVSGTPVNN
ncbi:MAG: glycosyltransferase family 4 protein [Lacibacter sp.]|jgi:glycosyltransferase involved in cell wall biosynthesis